MWATMRMVAFCGFAAAALFQSLALFVQGEVQNYSYEPPQGLQQILSSNDSRWRYPTDFTRGIEPKPLHSHNDYWREVPFYSALAVGAISVEADIWLINGSLLVGHEESALSPDRTLSSLYIKPILNTLRRLNPDTEFAENTKNGVFDTSSDQTLYLWLDCKTEGEATFRAAIKALEPLRSAGFLTTYTRAGGVRRGAVTVTGTGNTPLSFFTDRSQTRDYFFDASLPDLGPGRSQANITSNITQIASTNFAAAIGVLNLNGSLFSSSQLSTLQQQISTAKAKGIGARYWGTPGWPVRVREGVWKVLFEQGVALINVDDLEAAAFQRW